MQSIRTYAGGDDKLRIRLNAQYNAMSRASQGAHGHLLRAQTMRYKREQSDAALKADDWTQYIVTRTLEQALEAGPKPAMRAAKPSPSPSPSAPVAGPQAVTPQAHHPRAHHHQANRPRTDRGRVATGTSPGRRVAIGTSPGRRNATRAGRRITPAAPIRDASGTGARLTPAGRGVTPVSPRAGAGARRRPAA